MKKHASYRMPLIIAVGLHLALFIAFGIHAVQTQYRWHVSNLQQTSKPIVHATAIDQKQLNAEIKQIQWKQAAKQRAQRQRLQQLEHQALLAKKQRVKEERRLQEAKREQAELLNKQRQAQKLAWQKAQQLKQKIKQMRLAKLSEQQQALQQKLMQQQLQAEQQQLAAHQQTLNKQHAAELQGQLDKYRAEIRQVIQNNWHPQQKNPQLYCQLLVHVAPKGVVSGVELVQSSGDAALDRSARVAILKSSPLPVPEQAELFDQFRRLRIKMSPQEIKGVS